MSKFTRELFRRVYFHVVPHLHEYIFTDKKLSKELHYMLQIYFSYLIQASTVQINRFDGGGFLSLIPIWLFDFKLKQNFFGYLTSSTVCN